MLQSHRLNVTQLLHNYIAMFNIYKKNRRNAKKIYTVFKKDFTLLEFIITILIVGILAVTAMPAVFSLSKAAQIASDQTGIAAVQTAITAAYMKSVASGNSVYPSDNPFNLTTPPMPSQDVGVGCDNRHWQHNYLPSCTAYYLYCPHFRQSPTPKGTVWYFTYGNSSCWGRKKGEFIKIADYGH